MLDNHQNRSLVNGNQAVPSPWQMTAPVARMGQDGQPVNAQGLTAVAVVSNLQ
jgi:hypothetical protein